LPGERIGIYPDQDVTCCQHAAVGQGGRTLEDPLVAVTRNRSPKPPSNSNVQVRSAPDFGSVPIICIPVKVLSFWRTVNRARMNDLFPNHS
jgi:hypothetical protein